MPDRLVQALRGRVLGLVGVIDEPLPVPPLHIRIDGTNGPGDRPLVEAGVALDVLLQLGIVRVERCHPHGYPSRRSGCELDRCDVAVPCAHGFRRDVESVQEGMVHRGLAQEVRDGECEVERVHRPLQFGLDQLGLVIMVDELGAVEPEVSHIGVLVDASAGHGAPMDVECTLESVHRAVGCHRMVRCHVIHGIDRFLVPIRVEFAGGHPRRGRIGIDEGTDDRLLFHLRIIHLQVVVLPEPPVLGRGPERLRVPHPLAPEGGYRRVDDRTVCLREILGHRRTAPAVVPETGCGVSHDGIQEVVERTLEQGDDGHLHGFDAGVVLEPAVRDDLLGVPFASRGADDAFALSGAGVLVDARQREIDDLGHDLVRDADDLAPIEEVPCKEDVGIGPPQRIPGEVPRQKDLGPGERTLAGDRIQRETVDDRILLRQTADHGGQPHAAPADAGEVDDPRKHLRGIPVEIDQLGAVEPGVSGVDCGQPSLPDVGPPPVI